MKGERVVGGMSCSQVLTVLSDYLDGELAPGVRATVELHLQGCDACTQFGGDLSATITALRAHLLAAADLPESVTSRFREALAREPTPRRR